MDKVVDHLLVFNGNGQVQDFPGNYTQYRQWKDDYGDDQNKRQGEAGTKNGTSNKKEEIQNDNINKVEARKHKLTYKEKTEFERLEKEIENLEKEKCEIEQALSSGAISVEEITKLSKRLPVVTELLDDKTMRWLELSEYAS